MSFLLFIPSIYIASRRALVAYDCFFFFFPFLLDTLCQLAL